MKKLILSTTMLLAALMLALTGCENASEIKLNWSNLDLEVGDTETLKLMNGDLAVNATWAVAPESGVVTLELGNGGEFCGVTGVAEGTATVTATYDGKSYTCAVTVAAAAEEMPVVEAPGDGLYRFVFHVPAGTCNGFYMVGEGSGFPASYDINDDATFSATKIEGKETWYQVDMPADVAMKFKPVARPDGVVNTAKDWKYQANKVDGIKFVEGKESEDFVISYAEYDEAKLQDFTNAEGNVVYYLEITGWQNEPCGEPEPPVPGGEGTFTVTVDPSWGLIGTEDLYFVGNFGVEGDPTFWNPAGDESLKFTANAGTWTWTGTYPEAFEFKIAVGAGGTWETATILSNDGGNFIFDGETFAVAVPAKPAPEVE